MVIEPLPSWTALTQALEELINLLCDCVAGGASIGFLAPLSRETAHQYWLSLQDSIECKKRLLWIAKKDGKIVGSAQLNMALPLNQPHRAEVSKLMVHRKARRRGIGRALMEALEKAAHREKRTLLTLDTTGDGADTLYEGMGYTRAGIIPHYALSSAGIYEATHIFYKELERI